MVATALAGSGAAVAVVARSGDELVETVDVIEAAGGLAVAAIADVPILGNWPQRCRAFAATRSFRPPDQQRWNGRPDRPFGKPIDANEWWTTMDVNLRGIVLASRLVLPAMVARRRGRIINITSQAGVHRWPLVSAYSVSKAAVVKLTENLAHETARHGVGVFSVHPGLLPIGLLTSILANQPSSSHEERIRAWALNEFSEGRGADPTQAIDLILRVAAGDADRLSGRHLSVHDDLDAMLCRRDEVLADDLYLHPAPARTSNRLTPAHVLLEQQRTSKGKPL
jgi:NAD(P)-dependent dehydrogenase (short-subunit alcohol dehydrogenase family)